MSPPKIGISILILLVIALHAAPVIYSAERKTLWPFLRWSMYKGSVGSDGVRAHKRQVIGRSAGGEEVVVTPELAGLSPTVLDQRFLFPMWKGDPAAAQALIARLNGWRADPLVELRIESETWAVTDGRLTKRENPVISFAAEPPSSGAR